MKDQTINLYEQDGDWVADRKKLPGSPIVGRGQNPLEAIGALVWEAQHELGLKFGVEVQGIIDEYCDR